MKQDPVIDRLVPNPAEVPDVRCYYGLVGNSASKDSWRLYLSPNLTNYIEFSKKDVVHYEPLKSEEKPLGGTLVWLKRDAKVRRIQATPQDAQSSFLQGSVRDHRHCGPSVAGHLRPVQYIPFSPSFHFWSICDELAAPSFLSGGTVFCGGKIPTSWEPECP
jgi:hypothetical protein